MIDLVNEILATLRHNKLRTALTGFAVSWGIFLLIVLLSVSHGLVNGMNDMFSRHDTESITVEGGWAFKPYKGLTDGRKVQLRERDINLIRNRNDKMVTRISATISNDTSTISTGKDYVTGGYQGVYPAGLKSEGATMLNGRFINDNDIQQARRVIVLHTDNAKNLFGEKNPIGKLVKMNDLTFMVVGVFKHEWNTRSFIPYSTARNLSGGSDKVENISVGVSSINSIADGEKAEQDIYTTLGNEHNFDSSDQGALWIRNYAKRHLTQNTASGALELAVWIISILTMLSGIVGVSNIMFVSVKERTHEIGVRRAIGARPLNILKQVMLESVVITTIFGYTGIVLGVIASEIIDSVAVSRELEFLKDPSVDLGVAVQVTVVLIIAGAAAGLFPAMKSLKIKPVEALRDE